MPSSYPQDIHSQRQFSTSLSPKLPRKWWIKGLPEPLKYDTFVLITSVVPDASAPMRITLTCFTFPLSPGRESSPMPTLLDQHRKAPKSAVRYRPLRADVATEEGAAEQEYSRGSHRVSRISASKVKKAKSEPSLVQRRWVPVLIGM